MHEQDLDFDPNIKIKHRVVNEEPDELGRRKWKLEHYEQEQGPQVDVGILNRDPRTESFLIGRTEKLAINSRIGRNDALKKTRKDGGFFCEICKQLFKCDSAYLTHLNSSSHNRKLGMSLKVQGVNADSVRSKLASKHSINAVLSKHGNSKPSAMEQVMNKAGRKKEKMQQKEEQKMLRAERQVEEKIVTKQEKHEEHQDDAELKQQVDDIENQSQINPSTLQVADETELLMKSMGLPTSFTSKSHRKK